MSCLSGEECTVIGTFFSFIPSFPCPPRRISKISIKAARAAASSSRRPTGPTGQGQAEAGCQVLVCDESMAATLTQGADHRRQREHLLPT